MCSFHYIHGSVRCCEEILKFYFFSKLTYKEAKLCSIHPVYSQWRDKGRCCCHFKVFCYLLEREQDDCTGLVCFGWVVLVIHMFFIYLFTLPFEFFNHNFAYCFYLSSSAVVTLLPSYEHTFKASGVCWKVSWER